MATRKNREQLKERFRNGARPSGDDFADLIESSMNCVDDGVERPDKHDPVRIAARDKDHNILDLADADDTLAWRLRLTGESGKPGLDLADSSGKSRIFIEQDSGNVGIGSSSPSATFDVEGTVRGIPVVDFQKVSWSFSEQKDPSKEITLVTTFPGPVLKAEAMLGSWRMEYNRRERIKSIGIEISSLTVSGNNVELVVRCFLDENAWIFNDTFSGSGNVIVIATIDRAIHEDYEKENASKQPGVKK
ncbi:MAG: hypothetical protein JW712_03390 [Dehalococcoidales bacterium]|nr:hypothetical protein [Dehalococcoidales bacterium]